MNSIGKILLAAIAAAGLATIVSFSAAAADVIEVSLTDTGAGVDMPKDLGMGMNGDMSKATMGITVSKKQVKAGQVTFNVTNASKELIHEMLVAPVADVSKPLPFIANDFRVDEEAAKDLGEVSELDPGKSGSLTITLKPGIYILFCNIAGHYMAGMWTLITAK
ncbi:MAG: cupredoxin domain-containing protein [Dongiaceae bacterium]